MKDLFDREVKPPDMTKKKQLGVYQQWKARNGYRLGTKDQCCKLCKNRQSGQYHGKVYHKCNLLGMSHSTATDIRLKNVCNLFEKE